ncbi:MAG: STAS/SEC14 domain-containing protein [Leptospiraceae bacterium]|nr:STAS/SEC14 domain-containing protein [Leptospiraceae bacterium]
MFQIKSQNNQVEVTMSGKLDSEGMKRALDEFEQACLSVNEGTMLYDVVDFHIPSLDAVMIEFSRFPTMIGLITRFRKAALLTDKEWLKKVSEFEGMLIPGLEIKGFAREDRETALAWLQEK